MAKKEGTVESFSENSDRLEKFDFKDSIAWLSDAGNLVRKGKAVEKMDKDGNGDCVWEVRALNEDGSSGEVLVLVNMTQFMKLDPRGEKRAALKEMVENGVIDKKWSKLYSGVAAAAQVYRTAWSSVPDGKQIPVLDKKIKRALGKRRG